MTEFRLPGQVPIPEQSFRASALLQDRCGALNKAPSPFVSQCLSLSKDRSRSSAREWTVSRKWSCQIFNLWEASLKSLRDPCLSKLTDKEIVGQ